MQEVIDIPEHIYKSIKAIQVICGGGRSSGKTYLQILVNSVRNGTPLPKGHGRLIDADAFITTMENESKRQRYKELLIDDLLTVDDVFKAVIGSLQNKGLAEGDAPTIIEADKESIGVML